MAVWLCSCGGGDAGGGAGSGEAAAAATQAGAAAAGGAPAAAPKEKEKEEKDKPKAGLSSISKLLAEGMVHRGVTYPMFEEGRLKTVLTAEEMIRVSDDAVDLRTMGIETFAADGDRDYRIDLKSARYFLESEELASDEETVITGRTFTLRGDRMIYQSDGGVAQLEGNIVMVIKDAGAFTVGPEGAGDSGENGEPTD